MTSTVEGFAARTVGRASVRGADSWLSLPQPIWNVIFRHIRILFAGRKDVIKAYMTWSGIDSAFGYLPAVRLSNFPSYSAPPSTLNGRFEGLLLTNVDSHFSRMDAMEEEF